MGRRIASTVALLVLLSALPASAAKRYSYSRLGNAADAVAAVSGGTVLMGGGTDVDAAFAWMCGRAPGGDFLVLRASGTDAYNPYILGLCPGLNSVATLIVPSVGSAGDPFVVNAVRAAEAIFIAGGDQSDYVNDWKGTPLQDELNLAIARNVPVGGTSAGMMVLTPFIYSAQASQGATSSQALADPFNRYVSLDRDFATLPDLAGTVGDSHFVTRDRMGRDLAFMCRIAANLWTATPRSISVDEETALLVDARGTATVAGIGAAYFLQAFGPAQVCEPKTPLTYLGVEVQKVPVGGGFSFGTWRANGGVRYTVDAQAGVLRSSQQGGSIY
jgi:cyanophycinase